MRWMLLPAAIATIGSGLAWDAYREGIEEFRKNRAQSLMAAEGWLSVAGLDWLAEGSNSVGWAPEVAVKLPGEGPAEAAMLTRLGSQVSIHASGAIPVKVNGQEVTTAELKSDAAGQPDRVRIGELTFTIIQRGSRIGVRLFDLNKRERREFKGLSWYPIKPSYVVKARFVPYSPPKPLAIANVIGDTDIVGSPGFVEFTLNGKKCRMDAQPSGGGLFFNFADRTSGKATYPAGRFLYTPGPEKGFVTIDFNRTVNPPCAYTEFATCPLPPEGNRLPVEVAAGEKHAGH